MFKGEAAGRDRGRVEASVWRKACLGVCVPESVGRCEVVVRSDVNES